MYRFLDTPRRRSLAGFVAALLFIPLMLGVTACLDTPIGDPERGWVDPRVTGAWLVDEADPDAYAVQLWLFEPYDSRTWLMTALRFEDSVEEEPAKSPPATPAPEGVTPEPAASQDVPPSMPTQPADVLRRVAELSEDRARLAEMWVFKAWLTSIADRRFLVLEPKGFLDSDRGFDPDIWFAYRIVLKGERMELALLDVDADDLGKAGTRGAAEEIVARHATDPDFYVETETLLRIPQAAFDDIATAMHRSGFGEM